MRTIAVLAGLALAVTAVVIEGSIHDGFGAAMAGTPPLAMGTIAAALAMSERPGWRRAWIAAAEVCMLLLTVVCTALGLMLFIVPGLIVLALAGVWFGIARSAELDVEQRAPRVVLATGVVWTAIAAAIGGALAPRIADAMLASSLGLVVSGAAWWRVVQRTRRETSELARALLLTMA